MAVLRALLVSLVSVGLAAGVAVAAGGHGVHLGGLPVTVWVALLAFTVNWLAFIPAAIGKTERFYDAAGAVTFLSVVALALVAVTYGGAGIELSRLVPAALVAIWALRLGTFLLRRVQRVGKDGRFDEMKQQPARFFVAWTLQGLWVFLTSIAAVVLITTAEPPPLRSPLAVLGWALWGIGFAFEVVADRQKAAFQADANNRGRFIDVGLWAWSRHPNYFGEMLLWLGLFVSGVGAYAGGQWIVAVSPLFVIVLLTRVSGIPLLEKRADDKWGSDAAYQAYKAKTPVLLPRPPRTAG